MRARNFVVLVTLLTVVSLSKADTISAVENNAQLNPSSALGNSRPCRCLVANAPNEMSKIVDLTSVGLLLDRPFRSPSPETSLANATIPLAGRGTFENVILTLHDPRPARFSESVAAAPEPSSLGLLAGGLVMLLTRLSRRKRA